MYHKIAKQVFRKITVIQSVNLIISMLLSIVVARSLANIWTSFSIDNRKSVRLYLLLFTMAFLCQILLKYIFSIFINKQKIKTTQRFHEIMYFNIINSGIDREKNVKNGDVIIFFQKDAEQIASYYCINVPFYIQSIMGFICYAAYYLFFIKRPLVICVLFIISLFQFLPPYLTKKYFIKNYAAAGQSEGELTQWIISGVSGFFRLKCSIFIIGF